MKDIRKPGFMKAALTSSSHAAVLEMLIALLVFFVGDIIMGILQAPALAVYLFGNQEYMRMVLSNSLDFNKIMNMVLDMPDWMMIVSLLSEAALIAVFILYCRIFEKRKPATLGFRKKKFAAEYLRGIVLGAAAFVMAYGICVFTGSVKFHPVSSEGTTGLYIVGFLLGYLIQGMAEEVICRGYLLVSLSRRYSVTASIVFSAVFFAMLHGLNAGVGFLAFLNLTLFGIFMGLLFVRYENIWIVGAVHSIWNFMQGNIFGIQVSGTQFQPSIFTSDIITGKELINGGSFGAEGGLAVTVVLLFASALLLLNMSREGYFASAEPVVNPYDKMTYGGFVNQNMPQNPDIFGGQGSMGNQTDGSATQASKDMSGTENQNVLAVGNVSKPSEFAKSHENMGINPQETPWHPEEEPQKNITGFDQNYFKD